MIGISRGYAETDALFDGQESPTRALTSSSGVPSKALRGGDIASDAFAAAVETQRETARGRNRHEDILRRLQSRVKEELAHSKQQVLQHVLHARALERAQDELRETQEALHAHLVERSDPLHWRRLQRCKHALQQDFSLSHEDNAVQRLSLAHTESSLSLREPLAQTTMLLEAMRSYNHEELVVELQAMRVSSMKSISREVFVRILHNITKQRVSLTEADTLFLRVLTRLSPQSKEEKELKCDNGWEVLQNIQQKRVFLLFLVQKSHEFVADLETKKVKKSTFQFPSSSPPPYLSPAHTLSSSVPALSASLPFPLPSGNDSYTTLSHTSLSRTTPRLTAQPHTSRSHKQSKRSEGSSGNKSNTNGNKPHTQTQTLRERLQRDLQQSVQREQLLRERISSDMAQLLAEGLSQQQTPITQLAHTTERARTALPAVNTPSQTRSQTRPHKHLSQKMNSASNPSLPLIPNTQPHTPSLISDTEHTRTQIALTSLRSSPAVTQVLRERATQRLLTTLVRHVLGTLRRRLTHWQRVTQTQRTEHTLTHFVQHVACLRLWRMCEWNVLRRQYRAVQQLRRCVDALRERERDAAAIDIQRCFRGFRIRQSAHTKARARAARVIQTQARVWLARRVRARLIHTRLLKDAVALIERVWRRNVWRRTLHKAFTQQKLIRAVVHIQRVHRGHRGRRRVARIQRSLRKKRAAILLQSLWRRYRAVLRVERLRLRRRRTRAAITLQTFVRCVCAQRKFRTRWLRHKAAQRLQYAWWCYIARRALTRHKRERAARLLQRVLRGCVARQRVRALRARRLAAIKRLHPLLCGHVVRLRWREKLRIHREERARAAEKLQQSLRALYLGACARKHVRVLREEEQRERLREEEEQQRAIYEEQVRLHAAAIMLQRCVRGWIDRLRVQRLAEEREREMREMMRTLSHLSSSHKSRRLQESGESGRFSNSKFENMPVGVSRSESGSSKVPFYYKLREKYLREQERHHRPQIVRMQTLFRVVLARKRVSALREERERARVQAERDREALAQRVSWEAQEAQRRRALAMHIQRVFRGVAARRRVGLLRERIRSVKIIQWAIMEFRVTMKAKHAIVVFRMRKRASDQRKAAAIKIQALMRGALQRRRYKKSHRSLLRQRAIRIRARKEKAALKIQCAFRCHRARKRVEKQRMIVGERVRERLEMEALEKSIVGFHEEWMQQLLIIRAQTGIRGMLARKEFEKRVHEYKAQQAELEKKKKHDAAARIQALCRGVVTRKRHRKNLPALRKALKMRSYCVECELKIATRRCRQCKDRYCNECYDLLHQKGNRKTHSWDHVKIDPRLMALIFDSKNPTKTGDANSANGKQKNNAKDWEEFYDDSARAKYWFNKKTGEASWINPLQ